MKQLLNNLIWPNYPHYSSILRPNDSDFPLVLACIFTAALISPLLHINFTKSQTELCSLKDDYSYSI